MNAVYITPKVIVQIVPKADTPARDFMLSDDQYERIAEVIEEADLQLIISGKLDECVDRGFLTAAQRKNITVTID